MTSHFHAAPGSFFAAPDTRGLMTQAERVEIQAYDRDGNPLGSATLLGSVQIEPIDVSFGVDRFTVTLTGSVLQIPLVTQVSPPLG